MQSAATDDLLSQALAAWERRDAVLARELFRSLDALPAAAALPAAQAEWAAGDYATALRAFAHACALQPADQAAAVAQAQALVACGQAPQALAQLRQWRAMHPRTAEQWPLPEFLSLVWRLDDEAITTIAPHLEQLAQLAPALEFISAAMLARAWIDRRHAIPMQWPSPAAQARWDSLLASFNEDRPPRCFGTAAGLRRAAETEAMVAGLVIECGVYHGLSLRQWQPGHDGLVHGFDSFQGLPQDWTAREAAGALSTGGRQPELPAHCRLWPGWFKDSLPPFLATHRANIRLLHVDCDVYSSTVDVLEAVATRLVQGTVIVFDDYDGYPGYAQHERRAWHEFLRRHGWRCRSLGNVFMGREAAFQLLSREC